MPRHVPQLADADIRVLSEESGFDRCCWKSPRGYWRIM